MKGRRNIPSLYRAGLTQDQIVEITGVPKTNINRILKRAGVVMRRRGAPSKSGHDSHAD